MALATLLLGAPVGLSADAEPLEVVTTTPDLAALVEEVGGDRVNAHSLAKGPQDPHFVEAKPSFLKRLHDAELYVEVGLELESGWAPALLRNARNTDVLPGARGHVDASRGVKKLRVPKGPVDRSMGDVHALGNPHYLLDPINGWKVAKLLRDRLESLRPEATDAFRERFRDFESRLARSLLGERLVERHPGETSKLLELLELGGLERFLAFLESQEESELLGGWLGRLVPFQGRELVCDHDIWPYFAERFGLEVAGFLEPRPGIAPTTRHLAELVARMRSRKVPVILSAPYFGTRHAEFVASRTEARIAHMAHQVGAREGIDDYLELVEHNVAEVARVLERSE